MKKKELQELIKPDNFSKKEGSSEMREKQNHIEEFWTQSESRRLEFKEQFPGGKQLAKTSVAFSNGGGGKIVFGVKNDPLEIVGIANDKLFKLEERITNHILDNCEPTYYA